MVATRGLSKSGADMPRCSRFWDDMIFFFQSATAEASLSSEDETVKVKNISKEESV